MKDELMRMKALLISVAAVLAATSLSAQSLGDVARANRAKKQPRSEKRVVMSEQMVRYIPSSAPSSAPAAPAAPVEAPKAATASQPGVEKEVTPLDAARSEVNTLQTRESDLQYQIQSLEDQLKQTSEPQDEKRYAESLATARQTLETVKADLSRAQAKLRELGR
jgi:peptidoglycan hydrolase CwlO-like protein